MKYFFYILNYIYLLIFSICALYFIFDWFYLLSSENFYPFEQLYINHYENYDSIEIFYGTVGVHSLFNFIGAASHAQEFGNFEFWLVIFYFIFPIILIISVLKLPQYYFQRFNAYLIANGVDLNKDFLCSRKGFMINASLFLIIYFARPLSLLEFDNEKIVSSVNIELINNICLNRGEDAFLTGNNSNYWQNPINAKASGSIPEPNDYAIIEDSTELKARLIDAHGTGPRDDALIKRFICHQNLEVYSCLAKTYDEMTGDFGSGSSVVSRVRGGQSISFAVKQSQIDENAAWEAAMKAKKEYARETSIKIAKGEVCL